MNSSHQTLILSTSIAWAIGEPYRSNQANTHSPFAKSQSLSPEDLASIELQWVGGKREAIKDDTISQATSQRIFSREASIELIRVCLGTN